MNKVNVLSKSEMKNVLGGGAASTNGQCNDWTNANYVTCYNCCIAYHDTQPAPLDAAWNSQESCDGTC